MSFRHVADYSGLLPKEQLLYLSFQPQKGFTSREFLVPFLADKQLQNFLSRRLRRSQLAIGAQGQVYAINQLVLKRQVFKQQLAQQVAIWQGVEELPVAYFRKGSSQWLQMPESHLLYFSQGLTVNEQLREQLEFAELWQTGVKRSKFPQRFFDLQEEQPLVAYSPKVVRLITNSWLQRAFPRSLSSFTQVGNNLPISQMLLWLEPTEKQYLLNIELVTGSLLLSRGLETGFRLFLPALLLRSKQEFLRNQLSNVEMQSTEEVFRLQIPLDQKSIYHILSQLKIFKL